MVRDPTAGHVEFRDGGDLVLRYNGHTAAPPGVASRIDPANRKYAVARSGYIHPLVGPGGAVLTADWPVDHPHHRGVYWAWPGESAMKGLGGWKSLNFSSGSRRCLP